MMRPGPTATKNSVGIPTAGNVTASLGLGDQLQTQVEDEVSERKKKLLKQQQDILGQYGATANALFGMGNPSVGSLF